MELKENCIHLTAKEVEGLVYESELEGMENIEIIDTISCDSHRWRTSMQTIFKYNDKYYSVFWMKGNTENCDDDFDYEVCPEVKKVPITTYVWKEV